MRKLHLICNAHLDPMWQWEWEDGAAAALATFYSATELADEFDYIFCHNELVLYKYIKEYDEKLYARIKELVKQGKWHIMGGWFLQPDCNMPSGEGFVRQIQEGKKFFLEEFGCFPKTAINFDSFGHSIGLPQIIKKCGQENYLICRPMDGFLDLKENVFNWVGLDGSTIKVCRALDECLYTCDINNMVEELKRKTKRWEEEGWDTAVALWGVGNHGGGPSRKALADIEKYSAESDFEVVHSTPENYFEEVEARGEYTKSLQPFSIGCYSSMSQVKQRVAKLENELVYVEKMYSVLSLKGKCEYPQKEFDEVSYDLLYAHFHDIFTGTSIKDAETAAIRMLDHGLEILARLKAKALFKLSYDYKKATPLADSIFVFNPHPYPIKTTIEDEIRLGKSGDNSRKIAATVTDEYGNELVSQISKERSYINYEVTKRVVFDAELKPLDVTRFEVVFDKERNPERTKFEGDYIFNGSNYTAKIGGESGLLESFVVDGREYIDGTAFLPYVCDDNEDPWGMDISQIENFNVNPIDCRLMKDPTGVFANLQPITVIEEGDIFTEIETLYEYNESRIRIGLKLYKNSPYIDVNYTVFWNEIGKMLKIKVPSAIGEKTIGQVPYGYEELTRAGKEHVSQRFIATMDKNKNCLALLKSDTYGCSSDNNVLRATLLRASAYCAHPIGDRSLIPLDRLAYRMENGIREFNFRLTVCKENELERLANEYTQKAYALNFFPHGEGNPMMMDIDISNKNITLTAFKKGVRINGYVLRLINNSDEKVNTTFTLHGASLDLAFGKFEVKTLIYDNGSLREEEEMLI